MVDGSGFVIPTVLVGGEPLAASFALLGIDVLSAVNRIPTATLTLQEPGSSMTETPLLAGGPFAPGAEVEIKVRGADAEEASLFTGLVTGLAVHTRDGVPTLEVTVKDKAVGLAGVRHSQIWADMTDADAISAIVSAAGLVTGEVPSTDPVHEALVQYESSDWDFILSRAEANGLVVAVRQGTVSLAKMDASAAEAQSFTLGLDAIEDIHFELDATAQAPSLASLVWDPDQLAAAAPADAEILALAQGEVPDDGYGAALGVGPAHLTHMVPLPPAEAKTWAAARMARARLALIRGRLSVPGRPDADVMQVAALKGFGDRFNGSALVTGVRHRVDARGFSTDLQFGLPGEPVGRLPAIADMPAGGLLPPIAGVQTGTVIDTADPETLGRVKVSVPAIATDPVASLWARVASPDAGPQRGFCFLPEVGDEVLVAFLDRDPRHPVVLGRLHGSKNPLPDGFTDTTQKGIITTRNVRIVFSEADKPAVTISTPGGRTVTLDDDGQSITVSDKNKNTITLDANGITIESGKDLTLKAAGALKVSGATIDLN